jgi:hypothetical protein
MTSNAKLRFVVPYFAVLAVLWAAQAGHALAADNSSCGVAGFNSSGKRWLDYVKDNTAPVAFRASMHGDIACDRCHHTTKNDQYNCSGCHRGDDLKNAFHKTCAPCHESGRKGPVECDGCHRNNRPANFRKTDFKLRPGDLLVNEYHFSKRPVVFPHNLHKARVKSCGECHHDDKLGKEYKCSNCHGEVAEGKVVDSKSAFHSSCRGCHKKDRNLPNKCVECHPKILQ